jgi:hypothetical protein
MKGSVGADDPRIREAAERAARGEPLGTLSLAGVAFPREFASPRPLDFTGGDCAARPRPRPLARPARISRASFRNVTLTGANFDGCAARGAVFGDVNLAYASFLESDLRGAMLFNANMADISLKGATLDGAEVNAIRLSLNGGTHVLGLKEALRALAGETSYPYIAGVSGDAFWISYLLKTRD